MTQNFILQVMRRRNSHLEDNIYKPEVFNLKKNSDRKKIEILYKKKLIWKVVDDTNKQSKEIFFVINPKKLDAPKFRSRMFERIEENEGCWVYYPWSGSLVHILSPAEYKLLRTSRNKNLITKKEQLKYEKALIAFAGLNVGNSAALSVALEGGSNTMRFADNDALSLSNLNRFRASLQDMGLNKAVLSARQVYEINPFAKITVFPKGINSKNIKQFILQPKVDLIVEEMDNLLLKIEIRKLAKKNHMPVVMVTGNGENVILDIERYDVNPKLEILNNYLKKNIAQKVFSGQNPNSTHDFSRLCRDFIGKRYLTQRLNVSFDQVGKTLAGIPQLAETSFLRGAVLSNIIRRLILSDDIKSGRYNIKMDSLGK